MREGVGVVKLKELREPLNTTTNRIVVVVLAGGFLFALIVAVVEFLGRVGRVCAPTEYFGAGLSQSEARSLFQPDVVPLASVTELCVEHPTTGQHVQDLLVGLPPLLFGVGAAALLAWFLWGAARPGPHSTVSPGRLRALGWFLAIGGPAQVLLGQYGEYLLRNGMLLDPLPVSVFHQEWQHEFPWWYVFTGLTALLLSRMLRIDVRMGEELEGTV